MARSGLYILQFEISCTCRLSPMEGIPEKAEEGVKKLYEENPDCIGHNKEEVSAFRDKVLVEVLKLHGKL